MRRRILVPICFGLLAGIVGAAWYWGSLSRLLGYDCSRPVSRSYSVRFSWENALNGLHLVTLRTGEALRQAASKRSPEVVPQIASPTALNRSEGLTAPVEKSKALMEQLSVYPPDVCGWETGAGPSFSEAATRIENQLIELADAAILQALNQNPVNPKTAAGQVLQELESIGEKANRSWPRTSRFHYKVVELHPAIVVALTIRSRAAFSVYGVPDLLPEPGQKRNTRWTQVKTDRYRWEEQVAAEEFRLHPLLRGASGKARFLSEFHHIGCGGGQPAVDYTAYEWDPSGTGDLRAVLHREGVESGITEPAIGRLETTGGVITLPYCWRSAVDDGSVWAALCSVDTYDISGDEARFIGTRTNRPDLEAVARVIQHAQLRDYRAVLAYSGSQRVARSLVELMPPNVHSAGVNVTPLGPGKEAVELSDDLQIKFVLESRDGQWLVVDFAVSRN